MLTATTFQIVFSEAVTAVAGDFTVYAYDADGVGPGTTMLPIDILSIAGSGTTTITFTTATNSAFASGIGTGLVNVGNTVTDLAGNAIIAVSGQAIATN